MLAVPYAHDQPDNALRAAKLGVARVLYPSRYRASRAAAALDDLGRNPRYVEAAAHVKAAVRAEDGPATACDALERTFELRR
jgi:UDP:flavonoid glycosyltransferase YjiC (YdhE family)